MKKKRRKKEESNRKEPGIKLSVVIPTINSEKFLEKTVAHCQNYLEKLRKEKKIEDYELILASQTSEDETFKKVRKLKRKKRIKGLCLYQKGKGHGLNTGIKKARYEWVLMIDDDLSYPIEFLEKALEEADGYDILIGSRYITKQKIPLKRKIASWIYRKMVKFLFGITQEDIQAGLKLFKKKIFKEIKVKEQRFVWDTEFLYKANKKDYRIKEIPIKYDYRQNVLRVSKAAKQMLGDMMGMWWREKMKRKN